MSIIKNPHGVTKSQVGLSNVDNVKQASKEDFDNHISDYNNLRTTVNNKQNKIVVS